MNQDPYKRVSGFYDSLFASMNTGLQGIGLYLVPAGDGQKVLDVGCGTGQFLAQYQKGGSDVHGIDASPSMLDLARERLGQEADLQLGDAANMPWDSGTFDLVMTTLVLHELNEAARSAILKEMMRVVSGSGQIMIIDFHPGPIRAFKGWYRKTFITISEILAGRRHYANYRQFLATGGLPGLLQKNGLKIGQQKIVAGGSLGIFVLLPAAE